MANSNLGCGPLTVKYLVFIFNFLFFLSGLVLICVGGIAQGFFRSYMEFFSGKYETPAIGIIILGSVILVISFFGCCGAKRENVYMLKIFAFLMIVVLLLEFAAAVTIAVLRPQIKELVEHNMNESMTNYGTKENSLVTKTWDDMQTRYHCCGTYNYTDWRGTSYGEAVSGVPDSCCIDYSEGCGNNTFPALSQTDSSTTLAPDNSIYTTGCYKALADKAHSNLGAIIGGIITLAIIQMIGVWMSCCLIKAVQERYEIL